MDRGIKIAAAVGGVAYFMNRDVRTALIMAAVAYGAETFL